MTPRYPLLLDLSGQLTLAVLLGNKRSFKEDARVCISKMSPAMKLIGKQNVPTAGPGVITVNHYSRIGFHTWWLAFGISAVVPVEVRWIFTAAWRHADWLRKSTITPATNWAFRQVANVYGFFTMPPMPPTPEEIHVRAMSVRRVLTYAGKVRRPLIGLAPEGRDPINGEQVKTPPGVGRFLLHLAKLGLPIIPVAAFETQDQFCLAFGRSYLLNTHSDYKSEDLDRDISQMVMARIRALLPEEPV